MGLSHIAVGFSVFAIGWLPMSCQHRTAQVKSASTAQTKAGVSSPARDLGDVTLTNQYETSVSLGGGKICILRPKMIDRRNADITVTLETQTSAGKIQDLMMTEVTAKNGEPLSATLGDFELSFTPTVVTE